ncbi:glycosyltransferase family 2 protein [Bombilactobacillus thymidiniphilus]|uniref:Glycosyltransferase n=1 Tax=Bombilactobacillus thymidiniphilus TaxID=2923363 RepID=A0ABY4PBA0_9LACO|nr:glycosyltransferase family 2 protein [Bombilactobacillus thymidiniphilus]UQS83038.1 glycosyltransferase [Bombilactobacillus thymidiniphilus]
MTKLSLVMPLYNEARLLPRSLASIVRQTNQDFELIMVNDASTDATLELAQQFVKQHTNFKVVSQPYNQGISNARNRGIEEASGELITFIDGDDWLDPNYVDYFLKAFADPKLDLAVCGFYKESPTLVAKKQRQQQYKIIKRSEMLYQLTKITGKVMGYTWNKVYRLAVIQQNHLRFYPDLPLMEDQVFNVQYCTLVNRFGIGTQQLYHYWQHNESVTHTYNLQNVKSIGQANYRIVKTILTQKS